MCIIFDSVLLVFFAKTCHCGNFPYLMIQFAFCRMQKFGRIFFVLYMK